MTFMVMEYSFGVECPLLQFIANESTTGYGLITNLGRKCMARI